jgi:hypothetical protein
LEEDRLKATITVQHDLLDPSTRVTREVEFEHGDTLADVCGISGEFGTPSAWVGMRDSVPMDTPLQDGDIVTFAVVPGAGLTATLYIPFIGVKTFTGAAAVLALAASFAVQVGFSLAVQALAGKPDKPSQPTDDGDSNHYGFGGIASNKFAEGSALPVVYGRFRVAGVIINAFEEVQVSPAASYANMLLLLAGHEVSKIGDLVADADDLSSAAGTLPATLQIDGQPATDLRDVECHVRMGTLDQSFIPGFETAAQQDSVNATLEESPSAKTGTDIEIPPGSYPDASPALDVWDTPVSFTMSNDGDAYSALLSFPSGLFDVSSSSGNFLTTDVRAQLRYQEVDGGGTPFGDVAVLPAITYSDDRRASFPVAMSGLFQDPSTVTAPVASQYAEGDSTLKTSSAWAKTNGQGFGAAAALPSNQEKATILMWVRLVVDVTDAGGIGTNRNVRFINANTYLCGQLNGSGHGFRLRLRNTQIAGGLGTPQWSAGGAVYTMQESARLELTLVGASGTATTLVNDNDGIRLSARMVEEHLSGGALGAQKTRWVQVGFSWDATANGTSGKAIVYQEGLAQAEANSTVNPPMFDSSEEFFVFASDDIGNDFTAGDFDEIICYQRALSSFEVGEKYQGFPAQDTEPDIIDSWHCDSNSGGNISSFVSFGNDLDLQGTATTSTAETDGPVSTAQTGTLKRGKYKVEIQRLNPLSTSGLAEDTLQWDSFVSKTSEQFEYPGCALLAVRVRSTDQLNTNLPLVTVLVEGKRVPVFDGTDPDNPTIETKWSRNPAWIAADAMRDEDNGVGRFFKDVLQLDWATLFAIAERSDELLVDGNGTALLTNGWFFTAASPPETPNGTVRFSIDVSTYKTNWPDFFDAKQTTGALIETGVWFVLQDISGSEPSWVQALEGVPLEMVRIEEDSGGDIEFEFHVPDGLSPSTSVYLGNPTVEQYEQRFTFDGIFDRSDFSAWEALINIFDAAQARPALIGSRLSPHYDRPRSPVAMFGEGNIVPGSLKTSWSGIEDRTNHIVTEFLDERLNYEKSQAETEHSTVNDPTDPTSFQTERRRSEGVTRRSQVMRRQVKDLNRAFLSRRFATFRTGVDSVPVLPGDVIAVSSDVPQWGFSGRLSEESSEADVVYLDRDIEIEAAKTYEIEIRLFTGTIEKRTVTNATGTYEAGERITVSADFGGFPQLGDLYSFGETDRTTQLMEVTDTKFDPASLEREISCVEYNADIYLDDFGLLPETPVSALPEPTTSVAPPPLLEARATPDESVGEDGSTYIGVRLDWTPTEAHVGTVSGYAVWVAQGSDGEFIRAATTPPDSNFASIAEPFVRDGNAYRFRIQPIGKGGKVGDLAQCAQAYISIPTRGFGSPMQAIDTLEARITGELVTFTWTGAENSRRIEIRAGGWILGQKILSAPTKDGEASVPFWQSALSNAEGIASPLLFARPVDGRGRYGKAFTFEFDPSVRGVTDHLVDGFEEPGWAGTKVNTAAIAAPGDPTLFPPRQRQAKLAYTGATTEASYEFQTTALPESQDVYAQVVVEADQVHPKAIEDLGGSKIGSRELLRWTMEGPLWDHDDDLGNVTVEVSADHTTSDVFDGTFLRFRSATYALKNAKVKLDVTRPTTDYDIRITRTAVRFTKKNQPPHDSVASEVFS